MKQRLSLLLPIALVALIGCTSDTKPKPSGDDMVSNSTTTATTPETTTNDADAATTLVSLKVPNMH